MIIFLEPDKVNKTQLLLFFRENVTHLSLYNLSVIHKKKYFDSEMHLMSYINDNWELLQLGKVWTLLIKLHLTICQLNKHLPSLHTLKYFMESIFLNLIINIKTLV